MSSGVLLTCIRCPPSSSRHVKICSLPSRSQWLTFAFRFLFVAGARCQCSGLNPAVRFWPSLRSNCSIISPSTCMRFPPRMRVAFGHTVTGIRHIGGLPMNWATKILEGHWYNSMGVPSCCNRPWFSTAMRCPMVIASTWSWVT